MAWLDREAPVVVVAGIFAAFVLSQASRLIQTDSWLALVVGRLIANNGLPSHDTLAQWTLGKPWTDQQWLAHLTLYGLHVSGGLRLVVLVHAFVITTTFIGAIVVARWRGATPRSVAAVSALALPPIALASLQVRPEVFAYLLFVAVAAILSSPRGLTWGRATLVIGLLVLWANVHGSVVLGVALVLLRTAIEIARDVRARSLKPLPWLLAAGSAGSLLASPYALALPHYYAQTLLQPGFGRYLAQWQPTTLSIISLPLFVLAGLMLRQFGRARASYSTFVKLAALMLLTAALLAMRNWVWFSLFAVMTLPAGIGRSWQSSERQMRFDRVVALVAIAAVIALAVTNLNHGDRWYLSRYPEPAADAVAEVAAHHRDTRVFATVASADWLLWEHPELAGRVAYDVRYELLDAATLRRMVIFRATGVGLRQKLERYDVLVLSRVADAQPLAALRTFGDQVKYRYADEEFVVVSLRRPHRG
jgi:hypothetical protein